MYKTLKLILFGFAVLAGILTLGLVLSEDASADDLEVNAWVPAKYSHPGDTIEIYAETSYNSGVSVEAEIYHYDLSVLEALNYYQIPDAETTLVDTISMEFGEGDLYYDNFWIGEFTIPDEAEGGVYGVLVRATDGVETAEDDTHSRLESLMGDHVKPLQDAIIVFRDGDMQATVDSVMDRLGGFNDTLNDNGGVPGVAHDVTDIQEWDNLMIAGKSQENMSDAAYFLEAFLEDFLQSDEYLTFEGFAYSFRNYFFDMEQNTLRDELTTDVYDAMMYIIGFDEDEMIMSHILDLENTEDIASAYSALQATGEYQQWKEALEMIHDLNQPFFFAHQAMMGMIDLAYTEEFTDLLDAFQQYLEASENYDPGNSPTQNLIYRSSHVDDEEMENLMNTTEFEDWLAALNETSLKDVVDGLNETMQGVVEDIEDMLENSTDLQDLEAEMEDFDLFVNGVNEWFEDSIYQNDQRTEYFEVGDVEWLQEFEMELYVQIDEEGTIWVNITDPDGFTYEYEYVSEYEWGDWFDDWEWFEAIPGEWEVTIESNHTGEGWYDIWFFGDDEAFMEYYLVETVDELFFVQNAGIAVQAPFMVEARQSTSLDFAVYNGEGALADTELNTLVLFVDPLTQPQSEFSRGRGWSGMSGWEDIGGDVYVNSYTTSLLITMDVQDIELDDTVTFILTEPDGTEHMYEYGFIDMGVHEEEITDPAMGGWDVEIEIEGDDTGSGHVEISVSYDPEPVMMPFWMVSSQSMGQIMSQETIMTDGDGFATLDIETDRAGIYVYFVELPVASNGEYYAATAGGFLATEFSVGFDLDMVGTIMGIPVYENPEGIGNDLDFDVVLSQDMDAQVQVAIGPMDFSDLFEDIIMDYDEDDIELFFDNEDTQEASLVINSPVSLITALASSPDEDNVQSYSLNFGILITSDTEVNITKLEELVPGARSELEIEATEGTPESTYGLVLLESWLDLNSFDVAYFSSLIFGGSWAEMKEPEPGDVADGMRSIIYGEDDVGFADIPALLWEDDFVMLTITQVDTGGNAEFGVYFGDGVKEVEPPVPVEVLTLEVLTADPVVNEIIQVKVTNESGDPVQGATVTVTQGMDLITEEFTDADGLASFQVPLPGTYHINVTKADHTGDSDDVTVRDVDEPEQRLKLNLPPGELTEDAAFIVTVVDQDTDVPVESAMVTILSGSTIISTGFTNAAGQVSFQLDAGTYTIRAEKTDYTKDEMLVTVMEVAGDDDQGVIPGFGAVALIGGLSAAMFLAHTRKKWAY